MERDVFNRYAFVLNDPINFRDPSGNGPLDWIFFIVGIVVAAVLAVIPGVGEVADAGIIGAEVALADDILTTDVISELGEEVTDVIGEVGEEADSATDVIGEVGEEADDRYIDMNEFAEEYAPDDGQGNPVNHNADPFQVGIGENAANAGGNNNNEDVWGVLDEFLVDNADQVNNAVPIDNNNNAFWWNMLDQLLDEIIREPLNDLDFVDEQNFNHD
jgi:hypothetical protein